MLECKNLTKVYSKKCVVDHISFQVHPGEVFALLGSNGAGKTTTIKMILGLVRQSSGEIKLKEGLRIGYSPDMPYFQPFLTGQETLDYYAAVGKMPKRQRRGETARLLEMVGLHEDRTKVRNYSKGMLQRLAIAQSLLNDPNLLILDEPTAGLDAIGRIEILNLIERLKKTGKTIILNSHILSDVERICDRGIIMQNGIVVTEFDKRTFAAKNLQEIFMEAVGAQQSPKNGGKAGNSSYDYNNSI